MIVSIVGYAFSDIAYSFHMLDIINRSETLRNVIRAVTTHIN